MVFHDDDDVSQVSVHSSRNTLEERQKQKEAELAPLKRKSVVQLYAPLFEGKKEEVSIFISPYFAAVFFFL